MDASHTRAVWSLLAVTTFEPSGLKHAAVTSLSCSIGGTTDFPVDASQIRAVWSRPAVITSNHRS